jgi:hypothetical protein
MDVNANTVTSALNLNTRDTGTVKTLGEQLADLDVLGHVVLVALTLLS